ncbi:MAG: HAMP domain-containing sensor histidine kinase [Candidatus Woesebacteria bacterium]|nr:HAMP domain-containing sensor histidine kinase [Candidatus Woesebacteria bacterium]
MFQSARLKLTAWYLTIIMLISIIFSVVIYGNVSNQIDGLIRMQNDRIRNFQIGPQKDSSGVPPNAPPMISTEELKNQEQQLAYTLLLINLGILVIAGGSGYFLAGRTLRPIKLMVDEQNQFISDASHELRTPIATLQAEMEEKLMEKEISDHEARSLIKSNLEELGTLKILTNSMLQLTKTHFLNGNNQIQDLSLLEIVNLAKSKVAALAKRKQIFINIKMPEIIVSGDKNALTEVFLILFENAIKYSSNASKVTVKGIKLSNKVKVSVLDHGIGISKEDIPHIFERFYRADKSRSLVDGYGLGLSIAKKIVETHNGSINVTSKLGKGSTFEVLLPYERKT